MSDKDAQLNDQNLGPGRSVSALADTALVQADLAPADLLKSGLIDDAARAVVTIDLNALRANYRKLRQMQLPGECGGVVKANGYGLGLAPVARALWQEGCRTFFVATLQEGQTLRQILNKADSSADQAAAIIHVLDGLLPGQALPLISADLRPVLGSIIEIESWAEACTKAGAKFPCAIHIDTGMNRLGLSPGEVPNVAARPDLFAQFDLSLIVTHLVSGEERANPRSLAQARLFDELRALLPAAPTSFANSAGTQLRADPAQKDTCAYDIARPGVALYGAHVFDDAPNPMQMVVGVYARVLKIRSIEAGETIGYNATWRAPHAMRVATLGYGYGDGLPRSLSSTNEHPGLPVFFGDKPAPLIGRVSMDYIGVDLTGFGEGAISPGDWAELIGPHVTIDDMAKRAGTNAYEILTSLGPRAQRIYVGSQPDSTA